MQMMISQLPGTEEFVANREFNILSDICASVAEVLSDERNALSERVALRARATGRIMGVSGEDLARLEAAARIHRLGEVFLDPALRRKSFIEMSEDELRTYRSYPIFTALRVARNVSPEVYGMLLRHREYLAGQGMFRVDAVKDLSLGARILCAATEYEELLMFHGHDAVRVDAIQRRIAANVIGRYDQAVINAMMVSVGNEQVVH